MSEYNQQEIDAMEQELDKLPCRQEIEDQERKNDEPVTWGELVKQRQRSQPATQGQLDDLNKKLDKLIGLMP